MIRKHRLTEEEEWAEAEKANRRYAQAVAGEEVENLDPETPHGESPETVLSDIYD